MSNYLDVALVSKTIKAAQKDESDIVKISFTDGTYLEVFVDDNDELVVQLCGEGNDD